MLCIHRIGLIGALLFATGLMAGVTDTLPADGTMSEGDFLMSQNNLYKFALENGGNLTITNILTNKKTVLFDSGKSDAGFRWSSIFLNSNGQQVKTIGHSLEQNDGGFVVMARAPGVNGYVEVIFPNTAGLSLRLNNQGGLEAVHAAGIPPTSVYPIVP